MWRLSVLWTSLYTLNLSHMVIGLLSQWKMPKQLRKTCDYFQKATETQPRRVFKTLSHTSKIENFVKIFNHWNTLFISAKSSILHVWQCSRYAFAPYRLWPSSLKYRGMSRWNEITLTWFNKMTIRFVRYQNDLKHQMGKNK